MGMPLFSTHSTPYASTARALMELSMEEGEPRRWQERDGDPEEESWWTGKHVFAESFIDRSARVSSQSSPDVATTSETLGARSAMEAQTPREASGAPVEQPLQSHQLLVGVPASTWTASRFPQRYTISEQELAQVSLDTVVNEDEEDDFELAWDEESDYGADDSTSEVSSTISTPTPSTPIATHPVSLPVTVPITPGPVRRRTMPVPTTPTATAASPMRTGSFQMSTSARTPPPSKSPIATRSVNRVRGFALASPRTELVL